MKKIKAILSGLAIGGAALLAPVQAFAAEEEETLGQKMSFAVQNTVIGIVTVFAMLLLMALVIYCLRFLPKLIGRFTKKEESANDADTAQGSETAREIPPAAAAEAAPAPDNDPALIAVIAAAIAADEQVPVGSFVVRTIKKRL